jgi:hypothetical protein
VVSFAATALSVSCTAITSVPTCTVPAAAKTVSALSYAAAITSAATLPSVESSHTANRPKRSSR